MERLPSKQNNNATEFEKRIGTAKNVLNVYRRSLPKFEYIESVFRKLPDNKIDHTYKLGQIVNYPSTPRGALTSWIIVRAEKGHYLLERELPDTGEFAHVICEEEELEHAKHE